MPDWIPAGCYSLPSNQKEKESPHFGCSLAGHRWRKPGWRSNMSLLLLENLNPLPKEKEKQKNRAAHVFCFVLWQRGKREQRDALHRVYMKTSNNQARNPGLFTDGEETRQQAKAHLMLLHASLTSLLWFWGVFL
jgi:hypothetical protein